MGSLALDRKAETASEGGVRPVPPSPVYTCDQSPRCFVTLLTNFPTQVEKCRWEPGDRVAINRA